jgi:hypothetical protein
LKRNKPPVSLRLSFDLCLTLAYRLYLSKEHLALRVNFFLLKLKDIIVTS